MSHTTPFRPTIALLMSDTLAAIGLTTIITRMMPGAEVVSYADFQRLQHDDDGRYYHYFVASQDFLGHAAYFLERRAKTIVLLHGEERNRLPQGLHTLNVRQDEEHLVRDILQLARRAHGAPGREPEAVRRAGCPADPPSRLTPREVEVMRLLVTGLINKEIADRLGVSLATIITHRKNIAEKLGTKSLSAMTIYAVAHGWVKAEEI